MFERGQLGQVPDDLQNQLKLSITGLLDFCDSPATYESFHILKEREPTEAMRLGTAIHMALLEPEKFKQTYYEEPETPPDNVLKTNDELKRLCEQHGLAKGGTKADLCKRLRDADVSDFMTHEEWVQEMSQGRECLSPKEARACKRLAERVKADSKLNYFMQGLDVEAKAWAMTKSGIVLKGRVDGFKLFERPVGDYHGIIIDVKKVPSVEQRLFQRRIWEAKLYIQAAGYVDLFKKALDKNFMFMWVCVESSPPYRVKGYTADFGLLEAGHFEYHKYLAEFMNCFETNNWPIEHGGSMIENASLPPWAWEQIDKEGVNK